MGIVLQGVEIGEGIIFRRVGKGVVRQIGEGLVHHHDEMHVLPQARLAAVVPALCLRLVKALRLVDGVGGELVAEAVGEPQFVEHRGNVVGVGHGEGVVEVIGGVDGEDQPHQNGEAGPAAQHPAQPSPQPGDGEVLSLAEDAQHRQRRRGEEHHSDDTPGEVDVVGTHSAAHFLQKGKVPGKDRLVPDLQLDAVGDGEHTHGQIHQSGGEKHVPQQAGERQHQQSDGHGVEDDQQRLGLEVGQDGPQGVGLAPQRQQRDAPGQQHRRQQRAPPGQPEFGKTVPNLQRYKVLS